MDAEFRGKDERAIAIASALRPLGADEAREFNHRNNKEMVDAMRGAISGYDKELADHPVFDALERVDRTEFLEGLKGSPYRFRSFKVMPDKDFVVPSPHMVAGHLISLDPKEGDRVLDIGTGSGYFALVTRYMVDFEGVVDSYEIDPEINKYAKNVFERIIKKVPFNVNLVVGDGFVPAGEEYDRIHASVFPADQYQTGVLSRLSDGGIALMYQARPEDGMPVGPLDVLERDSWARLEREDRELYKGGVIAVTREGDNLIYRIARETSAVQPAKTL
jgi:protein-L-isoaspartate O-methyltransferase